MDKESGQPPFNEDTIVADVIRLDPRALQRLIALSPKFRRLRNPVLRRTMARLATLADAARIAGLPVSLVVSAANGSTEALFGFSGAADTGATSGSEDRPDWFCLVDQQAAARLDVRPILDAGKDPLQQIMAIARTVDEGGALIIDAPFDPAPLRRVLARKGFVSYASEQAVDHFRVYFLRDQSHVVATDELGEDEAGEAEIWRDAGQVHIDVRGLEPPQPMLSILRLLEGLDPDASVIVHHEREPIFLYPELAERGWQWQRLAADPHEFQLRLARVTP